MKILTWVFVVVAIAGGGFYFYSNSQKDNIPTQTSSSLKNSETAQPTATKITSCDEVSISIISVDCKIQPPRKDEEDLNITRYKISALVRNTGGGTVEELRIQTDTDKVGGFTNTNIPARATNIAPGQESTIEFDLHLPHNIVTIYPRVGALLCITDHPATSKFTCN
jgi:hypothetical protein